MESILASPSGIMFVLGIFGVVFGVYRYFRDPQVRIEKETALQKQKGEMEEKNIDSRFKGMQEQIKELVTMSQNHIHTVDTKVDALGGIVSEMGKQVVRLSTIIDERIPKK